MDVEVKIGKRASILILRKDSQLVGVVSALESADDARDVAERLCDDTPASIRDRCYSLVQSIARLSAGDAIAGVDTIVDEAAAIVVDAKAAGVW